MEIRILNTESSISMPELIIYDNYCDYICTCRFYIKNTTGTYTNIITIIINSGGQLVYT